MPNKSGIGDPPTKPTCIELFAGAGGLSLGLNLAGFEITLATDNWDPAASTYRINFPEVPYLVADAHRLTAVQLLEASRLTDPPTLIAGGPPCQGFSSAGRRADDDPRNTLVGIFARLAAAIRPRFVLFENVEGFLTAGRGAAVIALLDPLIEAGYRVHLRKINAANFGVPQLRKRVILLAALGVNPTFPQATHSAYGAPGAHLGGMTLPATPGVIEALHGLPTTTIDIADHEADPLTGVDLERARHLRQGETMKRLPKNLHHESYHRRAYRRVIDGTPSERRGGAPAGLRRLRSDEPSKAVTAAAIREFLHPKEDRFLTIRECARLQTFPDHFLFAGKKWERILLIGNAVPPLMALAIGKCIAADASAETPLRTAMEGKLLSFAPSLSTGMSPVLEEVSKLVDGRYFRGISPPTARQLSFIA